MALGMKMFKTLGMVTLVTPPSMLNPEKISFLIINLKEEQKNQFARQLNQLFPDDNIVVYVYDTQGNNGWLKQASQKAKFVIVDQAKLPIWINEIMPEEKLFDVGTDGVEATFKKIKETL